MNIRRINKRDKATDKWVGRQIKKAWHQIKDEGNKISLRDIVQYRKKIAELLIHIVVQVKCHKTNKQVSGMNGEVIDWLGLNRLEDQVELWTMKLYTWCWS